MTKLDEYPYNLSADEFNRARQDPEYAAMCAAGVDPDEAAAALAGRESDAFDQDQMQQDYHLVEDEAEL